MKRELPAINGITIRGFKSLRDECSVPIRPLTILAGENSAGKSSLMQPLLLLKQTIEASFEPEVLHLNGDCVKVVDAETLFWRGRSKDDRADEWSVRIDRIEQSKSLAVEPVFTRVGGFQLDRTLLWQEGESITLVDEPPASTIAALDQRYGTEMPLGRGKKFLWRVAKGRSGHDLRPELSGLAALLPITRFHERGREESIRAIIHLPGLRGNPERAYPITRVDGDYPGSFARYTASVVHQWQETQDDRAQGVASDMRSLGITWKVSAKRIDDARIELRVGRLPYAQRGGAGDLVSLADVGIGASQVLPVVVALRAAEMNQLVHIEQPELHLHPRAQVKMAGLLVAAARRGARVVVETHSAVLLTAIQTAIAAGEIDPRDVSMNWFARDEDGATRVQAAEVTDDGAYGDWPVDFADVEMDIEQRYIDAAFERGLG